MIKVSDAVTLALRLLDRADVADAYEGGELTDEQSRALYALLHCYNSVEDELARCYFPLTAEENIKFSGGKFYYTSLAHSPIKILSLTYDGKPLKYRLTPQYAECSASAAVICYNYCPERKELDGYSSYSDSVISCTLIAYGIAAEYSLIQGAAEDSKSWESKYKNAIDGLRRVTGGKRYIAQRRWS